MTDYERGFEDGFAAAARCAAPGRSIAGGFVDAANGSITKKISIGFEDETFEFVRLRAVTHQRSFAAEVRALIEYASAALTERQQER